MSSFSRRVSLLCAAAACVHLAACGGGDGSDSGASSPPPVPTSSPPVSSPPATSLPPWQVPAPVSPAQTAPKPPPPSELDGTAIDIFLPHNALVYDGARNLFYASVPAAVSGTGDRIAIIDPAAQTIDFSAPVGADPGALAISADNSTLYVGLDGTGEVLRLALPSMAERGRVKLVSHPIFGQSTAKDIAASPGDPAVAAVAMGWPGNATSVALLRDMVMQPKVAASELLAFDSTGTTLYGLKLAFGSNDLSRMQVLADGLVEQANVTFAASGAGTLPFANGRVIAGRAFYNAPDLTAAGIVSAASYCRPRRSGTQLLCLSLGASNVGTLMLADAETFVFQDSLVVALSEGPPGEVVEGPPGLVALRYGNGIRLFSSDKLVSVASKPAPAWPIASFSSSAWRIVDIGIVHNWLAYDSVRNRYYAAIPGYVQGVSNSIATIDPATAEMTYSSPIGSEPRALAISADAKWLYVGLDGSGEVLRLALPSMAVQARVRLPRDPVFLNQLGVRTIAVSPIDSGVVAVSLGRLSTLGSPNVFSPSPGVVLLREMVLQPNRVDTINDLIAFDSGGSTLYGVNTSTSEWGLRRLRVLADGLVEQSAIAGSDIVGRALGFTNNRVVVGATLREAMTLTRIGAIPGASVCWPQRTGNNLLCLGDSSDVARLFVADSATFAAGRPITYASVGNDFPTAVVQGPPQQVAISYPRPHEFPMIRLFSSPQLP